MGSTTVALVLFFAAIATDLLDGYLARIWQQTSPFGGLLDHGSDAIFVTITLAVLAQQQYITWLLPPLVILSFLQYAIDSKALLGHPLRASQLGRYNGVAYFVLAGFPITQEGLSFNPIPYSWVEWLSWLLVVSTLASMANRLIAFIILKREKRR
ncbi:MAG: phosphatidylglycerophosphate synthase [Candidatus Azotimanducaceae bacterium]|jgi:phosphatidylglycerophosphate synthase